jgi:hypothetical protein
MLFEKKHNTQKTIAREKNTDDWRTPKSLLYPLSYPVDWALVMWKLSSEIKSFISSSFPASLELLPMKTVLLKADLISSWASASLSDFIDPIFFELLCSLDRWKSGVS